MTSSENLLHAKLNLETAAIAWTELQRFFATGVVFNVTTELDLVNVAVQISNDNRSAVEAWLASGTLARVSDELALKWFEQDATVWSVVVKPWILVQEVPVNGQKTVQ